jgi:hypothetical protein
MDKLSMANLDSILELVSSFEKIAGTTKLVKSTNLSWINYYLNDAEPRYHAWGYFVEGELRGMICWIESSEIKAWVLTKLFVRKSANSTEILNELYEYAVYQNEDQGIQQYFTITPHDRAWDKLNIPARSRYNIYTEHRVDANTLTGFANIDKDLLAFTPWPVQMVVKHFMLKNEYRE